MKIEKKQLPKKLYQFMWYFIKPYKVAAAFYVFLALVAGFWGPLNSIIIKNIINELPSIADGTMSPIIWPAVLIVLNFIIFDNFTWRGIGFIEYKYYGLIKNEIVRASTNYVANHSHQFFQDSLSGKTSNQITQLSEGIYRILSGATPQLLRGVALIIIALVTTFFVHPIFSLILFIWAVSFVSISLIMSKRLIKLGDKYAAKESEIAGQVVDVISNQSNIRMFAKSSFEIKRLGRFLQDNLRAFTRKELYLVTIHAVQGGLIAVMIAFSVYFLTILYQAKQVSIGDFALILGLAMEVGHITWYTVSFIDELNEYKGRCKQSLSALMVEHKIKDVRNAKELIITKGEIKFENVKFHYKGTSPLFNNKSIIIEGGQKVGLVGYSGSGKSTFANLILRLYELSDGKIIIDGQDISKVTQDSLRLNISMIPQEPSMFHRSIMENIRYGKIDASDHEVVEAAKKAHADEFIAQIPGKYKTPVGERGVKLSGGQRQRIAIARAFLKNAPILILDEATSQLDSITERIIQESLEELMNSASLLSRSESRTTLVIAHRLSTLLQMDRILVFDKGKIVQDGSHHELLKQKGLYKTLWDSQVGGFLPEKR